MFGVFCLYVTYILFKTLNIEICSNHGEISNYGEMERLATIIYNSCNQSSVPPELADGPPAAVIPLADVGEEVEIPEEDEEYHHVYNHQLG